MRHSFSSSLSYFLLQPLCCMIAVHNAMQFAAAFKKCMMLLCCVNNSMGSGSRLVWLLVSSILMILHFVFFLICLQFTVVLYLSVLHLVNKVCVVLHHTTMVNYLLLPFLIMFGHPPIFTIQLVSWKRGRNL